ncbi:Dihydroorotase [Jeotgalicoccus aerolatus]|uniref:Dihydroorotase n=1 Tax=Jeotgalicoccus aerolatus TaxID=709510 RepID=A0A1G8W5E3_9STAP|nr:dihydroorotase [Jeotgalicoccus aerolatus]MBP1951423.1 dihydroorotase [Jeotgalicoccus aerolatus]NMA82055.1 dihydroorotase [Jeotgalicoccus aerolatus]CAD2076722.1 Dihydroorotase [Jeotgalicoccus aerolatus]SDJ73336.1 dihydroorotase [Jeotgalicoccus aerolatus]GGD97608.1 dihydroorotase [Jeotgalicoccus aerolatus]
MLLKNATLLHNNKEEIIDVLIEDGKIKETGKNLSADAEVIDCSGLLLTPGLVDVHVHLREPGFEHKETIESGTKAAARGGFTTICPMPNTQPIIDTAERLNDLNSRIEKDAVIKVLPYVSITTGLKGETLVDFNSLKQGGAFAFTDDGVGVQSADMMYRAMQQAAKIDMAIVAHTEENTLIYGGAIHEGKTSEKLGVKGIPAITESTQIARDVLLAEAAGCHYHVCHVSTKESVRVIRDAKRAGIKVTAEVTPHHLVLDENDITEKDPNFKMNPPLRGSDDREALIAGLLDGTLDFIATDHAPHHEDEKAAGIETAPFGIVGIENAFQLLYTKLVKTGVFTLQQLIDWMTIKPSAVFGLNSGTIEANKPADLTLIDLNREYKLDKNEFVSKAKNTPFHGINLTSDIVMTIADGKIVYDNK